MHGSDARVWRAIETIAGIALVWLVFSLLRGGMLGDLDDRFSSWWASNAGSSFAIEVIDHSDPPQPTVPPLEELPVPGLVGPTVGATDPDLVEASA